MSRTLLFVPTYNERDNAESMCRQLLALGLDADVLFLDDNSPDGTGEVLDRIAAGEPRLRVVHRPGKLGVGTAHLDGIAWAYEHGYDTLVTLDCDFTHTPEDVPKLLAAPGGQEVVVGSRYLKHGSLRDWNLLRKSLTHLGHALTRGLLGIEYDATGAFRVYRLSRIPREIFRLVTAPGYAFFFESLFVLHKNGVRIGEVPIVLPARTYGHSKMSFFEPYRSLKHVLTLGIADALHPEHFSLGEPVEHLDPAVEDPQGWNTYWEHKRRKSAIVYDAFATVYRTRVIKTRLDETVSRHFADGSALLHAGCGTGKVDADLQHRMRLTAIDVSALALRLYRANVPAAADVRQASLLALPFEDGRFDGVYSLGVLEHFAEADIRRMLGEIRRVLRESGKVVLFWPHAFATSVFVVKAARWALRALGRDMEFHPPEISLLRSREHAASLLADAGLDLVEYDFGAEDGFVQAAIVARKRAG